MVNIGRPVLGVHGSTNVHLIKFGMSQHSASFDFRSVVLLLIIPRDAQPNATFFQRHLWSREQINSKQRS